MANVLAAMGSALYTKLSTHAGLTTALGGTAIYQAFVPQGTSPPYVVFTLAGGGDDNTTQRRARSVSYLAQVVANSLASATAVDAQIDSALHGQQLTIAGWGNHWMARNGDVGPWIQEDGGQLFWRAGGFYDIWIAVTS